MYSIAESCYRLVLHHQYSTAEYSRLQCVSSKSPGNRRANFQFSQSCTSTSSLTRLFQSVPYRKIHKSFLPTALTESYKIRAQLYSATSHPDQVPRKTCRAFMFGLLSRIWVLNVSRLFPLRFRDAALQNRPFLGSDCSIGENSLRINIYKSCNQVPHSKFSRGLLSTANLLS